MIIVIIAGGSGTRLWPLSTHEYPKHLSIMPDGKNTLLQATYKRAEQLSDKVFVITESSHVQHVAEQIPSLQLGETILSEPGRRGTASCMVYALSHLAKIYPKNDEAIVFMHADHLIRDTQSFTDAVEYAAYTSQVTQRLVLLGVEPTYPATGFGYIERGKNMAEDNKRPYFKVVQFEEKPKYTVAQNYIAAGNYLWNMGYFAASLKTFVREMKQHAPELYANYKELLAVTPEKIDEIYLSFKNEPIDTALTEKIKELYVVPGTFDWMDLGSYADLHLASRLDEAQNLIEGKVETEDVQNCYITNQMDIPIGVVGLDDIVVVATPKGILVANKNRSQQIGTVAKRIQ